MKPGALNRAISILNKAWTPHSGQKRIGEALFGSPAELVYVNCGRKFGKSESATYFCWLYALLHDNAEIYYLTPAVKLAKELVWANRRMQTCNSYDPDFIERMSKALGGEVQVHNADMRITFPNGSFIKVDGSDNIDSQLGLKPDFVVADEYRTFKDDWLQFVRPNMLVKRGKILFITTPPLNPNHAYETELECKRGHRSGDPRYFHINLPTSTNDRIDWLPEFLTKERARLAALGREKEFIREYLAQYVSSAEDAVIPQISRHTRRDEDPGWEHLTPRSEILVALNSVDSTQLGALISAFDPETGKLYVLDELFERDSTKATLGQFWPRVKERVDYHKRMCPHTLPEVRWITNAQHPWIARDLNMVYHLPVAESDKELRKPQANLSVLKDLAESGCLHIPSNIEFLVEECERWMRDPHTGRIPAGAPPPCLVDCLRFIITASNYGLDLMPPPPKEDFIDIFDEMHSRNVELWDKTLSETEGPAWFEE